MMNTKLLAFVTTPSIYQHLYISIHSDSCFIALPTDLFLPHIPHLGILHLTCLTLQTFQPIFVSWWDGDGCWDGYKGPRAVSKLVNIVAGEAGYGYTVISDSV